MSRHGDGTRNGSGLARFIRRLAVPIVLGWVALTILTNTLVPPLEKVGEENTVGLSARDAPAMIAMRKIGSDFQEFDSDSTAMVVLEGEAPLATTRTIITTASSTSSKPTPPTCSTLPTSGATR